MKEIGRKSKGKNLKAIDSKLTYRVYYLEITCPECKRKFTPNFVEDNYVSGRGDEAILIEDESCCCSNCNLPVYRSKIDECEQIDLAVEDAKREHPEFFDDEDESDEDNQESDESTE